MNTLLQQIAADQLLSKHAVLNFSSENEEQVSGKTNEAHKGNNIKEM